MFSKILRLIAAVLIMIPGLASAEPIKLKLAFFSSDRTHLYRSLVEPFVDAVNADGKGLVEIEVYLSGKLGSDVTKQSTLVLDGTADIVYVVQPYERASFPDASVIELPGLYRDGREGTFAFTRLVASGTMRGFEDFYVIGAVASEPESVHSRTPIASLAELKGKRIRANNATEIAILKMLDATAAFVPINETAEAISAGKIDGALVPPVPMMEFGVGRVALNHYMLGTSCVPLSLLMSKTRFESLPANVQALIRKYSGAWLEEAYNRINKSSTSLIITQLESDPHRKVVFPTKSDTQKADDVFKTIVDAYVAGSPHNAQLVEAARAEVAKIRTGD